ncbi:MAG: helix-turn-helix transcriptional regulator [Subdoligranulum variabile]|uniref:helix-turn-helix transcriptional regulator n=1 Tax=Gemmiger sp. TaxID=2049027 RepID=UPI002A90F5AD|nr:helix-turn-helix transcriptional regulator [Gemmiger sp.]MDD7638628.1 helix-turn-helix transcriptional regulator [Subdoligranulum variabile]MDY5604816.1 helix-turn-helix transcriptional regulator [Gemmiger sp.]
MKYTTTSPPNKANRLQVLRLSRGISQSALAAAVGVSTRTVKYWEHGQRTPNATSLLALAHHFDVPPESLLP